MYHKGLQGTYASFFCQCIVSNCAYQDLLVIGNQSRPKIFDLNIRRPSPLYSEVLEIDERVTLVGYTSDPQAQNHAVQFDEQGRVSRGYHGPGWDGEGDAEGPGRIVKGLSGEAVRILKEPGNRFLFAHLHDPDPIKTRTLLGKICRSSMMMAIGPLQSFSSTLILFRIMRSS